MDEDSEYEPGYTMGYEQAVRDIQQEFLPLWSAIQDALALSHKVDSFITTLRRREWG